MCILDFSAMGSPFFSSSVVGVRPVFLSTHISYALLNGTVLDPHPIKMRDFSANSWQRNK